VLVVLQWPKKKCSNFSTLAHWAENVFVVCFWADFWWKKIQQQLVAICLRVNGPISLVEVLISGCVAAEVVFVCLLLPRIEDWRRTHPSNSTSCTRFRVSIWCWILSTLGNRCRSGFVCCYPTWRTEETIHEIQHCVPILGFLSAVGSWTHWGGFADSLELQCTQRAGDSSSLFLGKEESSYELVKEWIWYPLFWGLLLYCCCECGSESAVFVFGLVVF
jgi:hypothetical protein